MNHLRISAVRCEALFASELQRSDDPSLGQVRDTIVQTMRRFGIRGCAERVAQEFGDHPETAVGRMRWVRHMVDDAFRRVSPAGRLRRSGEPAMSQLAASQLAVSQLAASQLKETVLEEAVPANRENDNDDVPEPAGQLPAGVR
jgi:hypothetical protein